VNASEPWRADRAPFTLTTMIWALAVLLLLALYWALSRSRLYSRLYGDAHLLAIAQALPALKQAALECVDRPVEATDARVLRTDQGLALVYTLRAKREGFAHHLSLSFPGQLVAQGAAQMLLATVVHMLRWPAEEVRLIQGHDMVQHAQWHASLDANAAWIAEPVVPPAASELKRLRVEALELRTRQRWGSEEMEG
jgi:hypothetical protein